MTLVVVTIGVALLIVVVATLVDIVRERRPWKTSLGWAALVILLPFVGATVYWWRRRPDAGEAQATQQAQQDLRRSSAERPFNSTGLWP